MHWKKIHGTSAHISWSGETNELNFSSGAANNYYFQSLFDKEKFIESFKALGYKSVTIYGEAYGGKLLKQSFRYGNTTKFVAFEVEIEDKWLNVSHAETFCQNLDLEFVSYRKISTDLVSLDAERDMLSEQSKRNGMGDHPREGVVLRPLIEFFDSKGGRVIVKHRIPEAQETNTPREISSDQLKVLEDAEAIAQEWVTPNRLLHCITKSDKIYSIKDTREVIDLMTKDILREAHGEIVVSESAIKSISKRTVELFKNYLATNKE